MTKNLSLVHTIETTIQAPPDKSIFDPENLDNFGVDLSESPLKRSFRSYVFAQIGYEGVIADRFYRHLWNARGGRYYDDFLECCSRAAFFRNNYTGLLTVFSKKCHLRWCPVCAKQKGHMVATSLNEALEKQRGLRFLTLTIKSSVQPLPIQITDLYNSFKKLRRSSSWKKHVKGGLWFFQVTFDKKTSMYHPHIHCIVTGSYYPQPLLKSQWKAITGDSFVVDIRKITSRKAVYDDVSRYVSRPVQLSVIPESEWLDVYDAFYGRRLCGSFGSLRKVDLSGKPSYVEDQFTRVADYNICSNMLGHDGRSRYIFYCWLTNRPFPDRVDMLDIENFIDEDHNIPPPDLEPSVQFDALLY